MRRVSGKVFFLLMGFVLSVSITTAAAQESIIYSFVYGGSDGLVPAAGLVSDAKGNLYGTTASGGTYGDGTVYELSPSGTSWTEKILYSFGAVSGDGITAKGGLIFDAKGNLYGVTANGGTGTCVLGCGTVFELTPSGGAWTEKVLYSFQNDTTDGANPLRENLVFDARGNLYGTTNAGGASGFGTVFELVAGTGGTWTEKVLYSFQNNSADGINPVAGVVFDAAGNLYGETTQGGAKGDGTVFELAAGSGTWSYKVVHTFAGIDGAQPQGGLLLDAEGNFFGTTYSGGNYTDENQGTVFELSPIGGGWVEQVLYNFTVAPDGYYPACSLVFDAAGNLYGTTTKGGSGNGTGTVFVLNRASGWKETSLHGFAGNPDGATPFGTLMFDAAGNLYGTTEAGGANSFGLDGVVYKIASVVTAAPKFSPAGGAYSATQTVKITDATPNATIYYSINGGSPIQYKSAITVSSSETITAYAISGSLPQSQPANANYQIGATAGTPWFSPSAGTYTLAQSVTITDAAPGAAIYYTTNGSTPTTSSTKYAGPISVTATETIKALAVASGYTNSAIASAVYTITPITPPTEKVLYNFGSITNDGGVPLASLTRDGSGNLYGTTRFGGPNEITYGINTVTAGTVFELSPGTGGTWTEKVLYNFGATSSDGALPIASLVLDSKGNLYGTTLAGGAYGLGTAFELSPGTGGKWTEKILYSFGVSLADGKIPEAGLIFDSKGNLYGTTSVGGTSDTTYGGGYGTVFELSPGTGSTWTENVLYNFSYLSQTDGYFPEANLVFDSKGNLWGTTADGGTGQDLEGGGTVFELVPQGGGGWTEKVIYNFGGGSPQGYLITGGVVLDSAGNVYGVAHSGGNGYGLDGTLFELSPGTGGTWTFNVLHSFGAYGTDGINPNATLIFDAAGNLFGTTYAGGANGYGTVFEMSPQTGGGWIESVVHSFNLVSTDGANPSAALILDGSGNLYGTTGYGGSHGDGNTGETGGTVFEIVSNVSGGPVAQLSPTSLAFGAVGTRVTSPARKVTLTNTGTASLSISAIAITGADMGDFAQTHTCGASLAAGASCAISVTFTPTTTGSRTASLSVTDNAAGSPQTVTISGVGTTAKLTPLTLSFGSVATGVTSPAKVVTLTNSGTASLAITAIGFTGTNASDFAQTHTCGSSLAAGASCTISVTFTPAATGTRSASLSVTDSGAGSPQKVVLSGVGTTAKLSPLAVAFGSVTVGTKTAAKTVTLTNQGTTSMSVTSIAITGMNAGDFGQTHTCGSSLAAGASCTISVTFTPAAAGLRLAALGVTDNAVGSPQKVTLSGTGK